MEATHREALEEEVRKRAAAEARAEKVSAMLEAKLAEVSREKNALMSRMAELEIAGEASEREKAALAAEVERRAQSLQRWVLKRLLRQGIERGFEAWREAYEAEVVRSRLMQGALSRLQKPLLGAAVRLWISEWRGGEHEALLAQQSEAAMKIEVEKKELAGALDRARLERDQSAAQVASLEGGVAEAQQAESQSRIELSKKIRSAEQLEIELKMERVALEDERRRNLELQLQVEGASTQVDAVMSREEAGREAARAAQREVASLSQRIMELEQAAKVETDPEVRLQELLGAQRATLEESASRARAESAARIDGLSDEKRLLEVKVGELEGSIEQLLAKLNAPPPPRPPSPEPRDESPKPQPNFKPFKFASDERVSLRVEKRAEETAKAAKAAALAAKFKAAGSRFRFKRLDNTGNFTQSQMMSAEAAAVKLQAIFRGWREREVAKRREAGEVIEERGV